jgi:hypothetical protein
VHRARTGAAVALLIGLAILITTPSIASAHRPAVRAEQIAMIYHASSRYYGGGSENEPSSAPLRCFVADISTVVKGSQWGAWSFSNYAIEPAHQRQCRVGNGVAIEHKISGRWYVLWEGDEGFPPTRPTPSGRLTLQPVPRPVAKDLLSGIPDN